MAYADKVQTYKDAMQEQLRIVPTGETSLYGEGIGSVILPGQGEPFKILGPNAVRIVRGTHPDISEQVESVVDARTPRDVPVNNPIPSVKPMRIIDGRPTLEMYMSDYRHWRGTLPGTDDLNHLLVKEEMTLPFNTTSFVITADDYLVAANRTNNRASHQGDYCLMNGFRLDRDTAKNTIACTEEIIEDGTGYELNRQARGAVATQLNISPSDVTTWLMSFAMSEPAIGDYGIHSNHLAYVRQTSDEIIELANELYVVEEAFTRYQPLTKEKNMFPIDEKALASATRGFLDTMAITHVPVVLVAGANLFGESWLENFDFVKRN